MAWIGVELGCAGVFGTLISVVANAKSSPIPSKSLLSKPAALFALLPMALFVVELLIE